MIIINVGCQSRVIIVCCLSQCWFEIVLYIMVISLQRGSGLSLINYDHKSYLYFRDGVTSFEPSNKTLTKRLLETFRHCKQYLSFLAL